MPSRFKPKKTLRESYLEERNEILEKESNKLTVLFFIFVFGSFFFGIFVGIFSERLFT